MLDDGRLRTFDVEDYRTRLIVQIAKLKEENNIFGGFFLRNLYNF